MAAKTRKAETLSGSRSTSATAGASRRGSGGAFRPGQAAMAPSATDAGKRGGRGGRRAAPGGQRQDGHGDGGEQRPLRIDSGRAPSASTASTDRAAKAAVAIQSGVASSSGVARCGSSAMKAAASASCRPTCTNSADAQSAGGAAPTWRQQGEAPEERAGDHGRGEPQPAAQPRQGIGRRGDDAEIDHERPGIGRIGRHQHRHDQRAGEPEAGQRRPVQRGSQHGGDADQAEQDEGRGRADEAVERMRGIDGAEGAGGAGGGQDARHVGGGDGLAPAARARCAGTIRRRQPGPAEAARRAPRARPARTRPARSNSAPAAGRRAPAPGRRPRPPSACRAALPAWVRARWGGRTRERRRARGCGGRTVGVSPPRGPRAAVGARSLGGRVRRRGWHIGPQAAQPLHLLLQPAHAGGLAGELQHERLYGLARVERQEKADEADQNGQCIHGARFPCAAGIFRDRNISEVTSC